MVRSRVVLLLSAVVLGAGAVTLPTASAAPGPCAQHWGSTPKSSTVLPATGAAVRTVTGVRAARHACYDRLVVDLSAAPGGGRVGYDVRYVRQVTAEGSGRVVPLRGGAALQVVVVAPAYDDSGRATYLPPSPSRVVGVGGFATFAQVAWAGSFEGQTDLGVGARGRLPFRVTQVAGAPGDPRGARLVLDVAHRW